MLERALISYAIFTVGLVCISFGMQENGAAHPRNPVWHLVESLRNVALVPWLTALVVWIVFHTFEKLTKTRPSAQPELTPVSTPPPDPTREAALKEERARKEEERKLADERRLAEEKERVQRARKEALDKKKKRSAEDAARSALDDFL